MASEGIARLRALGVEIADDDYAPIDRGPSRFSPNAPPIGLGSPGWTLAGKSPAFLALYQASAFYERWHRSAVRDCVERYDPASADEITLLLADLCVEWQEKLADESDRNEPSPAPLDYVRPRASSALPF